MGGGGGLKLLPNFKKGGLGRTLIFSEGIGGKKRGEYFEGWGGEGVAIFKRKIN